MTLIDRLQGWYQFFDKTEFNTVLNVLRKEYSIHSVMPDSHNIFRAFEYTPINCSTIVIGQDVYPQKNIGTGIPMFMMMDQNGNPIMFPQQGLDFNQMPMQMIPANFDPNQLMMGMGMMPPNTNVPQGGNMNNTNNNGVGGINDKNQQ